METDIKVKYRSDNLIVFTAPNIDTELTIRIDTRSNTSYPAFMDIFLPDSGWGTISILKEDWNKAIINDDLALRAFFIKQLQQIKESRAYGQN